jgi:hypothetical protein
MGFHFDIQPVKRRNTTLGGNLCETRQSRLHWPGNIDRIVRLWLMHPIKPGFAHQAKTRYSRLI